MRIVRETLLLSHAVQKGCILNFSEGSSGVARLKLSPRLVNGFMSKGLYMYCQSFISVR